MGYQADPRILWLAKATVGWMHLGHGGVNGAWCGYLHPPVCVLRECGTNTLLQERARKRRARLYEEIGRRVHFADASGEPDRRLIR